VSKYKSYMYNAVCELTLLKNKDIKLRKNSLFIQFKTRYDKNEITCIIDI